MASALLLGMALLVFPTASHADAQGTVAKGVNPKDNITKFELIFRRDTLGRADRTNSFTLKYDRAFNANWGGNIELPFVSFEGFGNEDRGLGDVQLRLRYSTTGGRLTWIAGAELVLPTAMETSLGRGAYLINPTVGLVPPLGQTAFLFGGYKHLFSVADDGDAPDVNESQPRLIVGYTSPKDWWLLGDAKYIKSWETDAQLLDREAEYGRMISPATGVWARIGTSALDSDREAMLLFGKRLIR